MGEIQSRKTGKEGKSANFYATHFKQGGLKKCFRCGGYSNEFSGEIIKVGNKYLHKDCRDPEDF